MEPAPASLCLDPYFSAQDDSTVTTFAAKTFTGKTLVTPVIPAGLYRYSISFIIETPSAGRTAANVDLDGADIFTQSQDESQPTGIAIRPFSRHRSILFGAAAAHTFELWIGQTEAGPTTVYETTQCLWRIG